VDPAKIRRRACAIAECTNTDKLFNTGEGEGNEDIGDLGLEVSGFTGSPMQTPEDPARELDSAPPSPFATDFMLATRTSKDSLL
jgi:hypothetical protein